MIHVLLWCWRPEALGQEVEQDLIASIHSLYTNTRLKKSAVTKQQQQIVCQQETIFRARHRQILNYSPDNKIHRKEFKRFPQGGGR